MRRLSVRHAVVLLGIVALIYAGNAAMDRVGCWWYGYQTERDTRFGAFVGCMVNLDGKWYPRSELRVAQ